jgi:hypothetical protein
MERKNVYIVNKKNVFLFYLLKSKTLNTSVDTVALFKVYTNYFTILNIFIFVLQANAKGAEPKYTGEISKIVDRE